MRVLVEGGDDVGRGLSWQAVIMAVAAASQSSAVNMNIGRRRRQLRTSELEKAMTGCSGSGAVAGR